MYKRILVAIDNSKYAERAAELAVELAHGLRAQLSGVHVTNAELHTYAFRLLEGTLPERYQTEEVLQKQREIHEDLIRRGLTLISDSYLEQLRQRAQAARVACETQVLEGWHYEALSGEVMDEEYDLAVFGHLGLGACERSMLGGVVERVTRRIRKDLLVVKNNRALEDGKILVAVDGSECSFWALRKAIVLAQRFQAQLHAVHVFDPDFHRTIFQELVGVLSREAAEVFDFEEQQELHDKVIDKGLEQVGQRVLRSCELAAEHGGIPIQTELLKGKFFEEIVDMAEMREPTLLVVGRFGRHRVESSDLGSTAENILRLTPCSVLVVSTDVPEAMKHFKTPQQEASALPLSWTAEAEAIIQRVPDFVQKLARAAIEAWARHRGLQEVQAMHIEQAMKELLPEKMWRRMLKEDP
ncbi:MAG: universal stress protein [Candidatus Bipolaricaulia bacterium]